MSDIDVYSAMLLGALLALYAVKIVLDRTRPRPFTAAALERHREAVARAERLEAERLRIKSVGTLPRTNAALPPTFITLGDAANSVVTNLRQRRDGRWTADDEAAEREECRRAEARGAERLEISTKRSAQS
jgi:hypothetical protein